MNNKYLKYGLTLVFAFLVGYFVFTEFLSDPDTAPAPEPSVDLVAEVDVQLDETTTTPTTEVVAVAEEVEEEEEMIEIQPGHFIPASEYTIHDFYANPTDGIEMGFPEGYEVEDFGVYFGPMVPAPEAPAGEMQHQYVMTFEDAQTLSEVEVAAEDDAFVEFLSSDLFGDFTVAKYIEGGLCAYPTIEIIGTKHNYKFSSTCSTGDADDDFAYMEDIIATGALIPDHQDPAWTYCETIGGTQTTFTADKPGGQYEVLVYDERTIENCLINDSLDGLRCSLDSYFDQTCGHPGSDLSPLDPASPLYSNFQ
jgi:hypothetical protein